MGQPRTAIRRWVKQAWKRLFLLAERLGVHVYPVHYYSQLPDTRDLRRRYAEWFRRSSMPGLAVDADRQMEFLREVAHPYREECARLPRYAEQVRRFGAGEYGEIESNVYYCIVRRFRPKRIVEVGSGISAVYALSAAEADRSRPAPLHLTCIDPFPSAGLRRLAGEGRIALVERIVQEADPGLFSELEGDDILFIDSTHTVKLGGDVNYLVLEVLPRLAKGVLVHFHDIPWPMPAFAPLDDLTFAQEEALVRAFLAFNRDFEILLCEWLMRMDCPEALREAFPIYDPDKHRPSSLWIRRRREVKDE